MISERWQQIERLYHAALEQEPGRRRAFLDEACQGDTELKRKVSLLLAEDPAAGKILDRPAWEACSNITDAVTKTMLLEGMQLGAYRIEARLGAGGMGEVYRATDTRLGRKVAVKIVSQEFASLFGREARAISALNHPHICTLYDIGPDFLVMELIEGHTLAERLHQGPLPREEVLHYGEQIADALAEAHAHGIIHRDLKPGNIMLRGNTVKVLDFGLAKFTQAPDGELTQANVTMGTPAYMAPEQVQGRECSNATDLFALGLVLYEMLTGQLPFPGGSLGSMLARGAETPIRPPCKGRSKIASRLNTLILGMLESDAARRPQSAATVREELLKLAQPRQIKAATIAFLTVAFLLAVGSLWWFQNSGATANRWPDVSGISPVTTYPGSETNPSASPDGKSIAFSWGGENNRHRDIYVGRLDVQEQPRQMTFDSSVDTADIFPAWSPDGQQIAFVRTTGGTSGGIFVIPAHGGTEQWVADIHSLLPKFISLAWTPDGSEIAFSSQSRESGRSTLFLVRLSDGRVTTLLSPPEGTAGDGWPAFSPDGRRLAFVRWSSPTASTLLMQKLGPKLETLGEPVRVAEQGGRPSSPAWADGKRLLFIGGNGILEWEEGMAAATQVYPSSLTLASLSMAGSDAKAPRVVVAQDVVRNQTLRMIPLRSPGQASGPPELLSRFGTDINNPDFSKDGKHIVFASGRSGSSELWIADPDGSNLRQLTRFGVEKLGIPRWSPDNRYIAFYARMPNLSDEPQIYVVDVQDPAVPHQVTRGNPGCNVPSWSLDGNFLYCSRRFSEMVLYRVPMENGEATANEMERLFDGKDATETADEQVLYVEDGHPGLFSRPLTGNVTENLPTRIVEDIRGPIAYFAPVAKGVYYRSNSDVSIRFFDYARKKILDVASSTMTGGVNSLTVSPDGSRLIYTRTPDRETDLALIQFQQ